MKFHRMYGIVLWGYLRHIYLIKRLSSFQEFLILFIGQQLRTNNPLGIYFFTI